MKKLTLFTVLLFVATLSSAETIKFKSGKIVEGKVIKLSGDEVRVDTGVGIVITYFRDEIESVDGKELVSAEKIEKGEQQFIRKLPELAMAVEGSELYYDTGELMSEGNIQDGLFRTFHKNGQIALEGIYKDFKPWDGRHVQYYEDGRVKLDQVYREGILLDGEGQPHNGIVKNYHDDGSIFEEFTYQNGLQHGTQKYIMKTEL